MFYVFMIMAAGIFLGGVFVVQGEQVHKTTITYGYLMKQNSTDTYKYPKLQGGFIFKKKGGLVFP